MAKEALDQEIVEEVGSEEIDENIEDGDVEGDNDEDIDDEESDATPKLPWEDVDEETDGKDDKVPLRTLMKEKGKLSELRSEKDNEIEELKRKIGDLESSINKPADTIALEVPLESDFDTDEEYRKARQTYESKLREDILKSVSQKSTHSDEQERFNKRLKNGVSEHWDRAEKFVDKYQVDAEAYQKADSNVRNAVESVTPNFGNANVDYMVTNLGDGSEKVIMYLGTNDEQLAKLQSLLIEDPAGHRASTFLGEINQKLKGNKRQTSKAKKPAKTVHGDGAVSVKEGALKKKYDKAHAEGKLQEVFNIKKQGRAAGYDTKKWS